MRHLTSISLLMMVLGTSVPAPVWAIEAPPPATQPAASSWTMPAAERQAIDAMIERAIAAGLPDAKGGTFLYGTVSYETVQNIGNSTHREQQTAEGLHLRLADGRLLLNLRWVVPTTGDGAVDITGLQEVAPDKLDELGRKHEYFAAWESIDYESMFTEYFAETELPKVRAANAPEHLGLLLLAFFSDGDLPVVAIMLLRMQVPGAEQVALYCAVNPAWNDAASSPFEGRAVPLTLAAIEYQWGEHHQRFQEMRNQTVPDPARILRLSVIGYFLSGLLDEIEQWSRPANAVVLTPDQASTAAIQMLDPGDPGEPAVRAELARLIERAALPQDIDVKADLATMLRWWSEPVRREGLEEKMEQIEKVELMIEDFARIPEEQRQSMAGEVVVARLRKAEINDLMALVNDGGVSRWLDQNRVRTVGDNALRALTMRMGVDPRLLIGRDRKALWTAEERSATTAGLTAWWAANRDKPLAEMMAGAIGVLSLPELADLVIISSGKDRGELLADIAKRWAVNAPKNPEPAALGTILKAAKSGKELDAVVTPWPFTGPIRSLLVAWHLDHGNSVPFDALLADIEKNLQEPPVSEKGAIQANSDAADVGETDVENEGFVDVFFVDVFPQELYDTLRIVARHPTPDRLTRVMTLVTAPAKDDTGEQMFRCISALANGGNGNVLNSLWGDNEDRMTERARAAIPLVLNGLLLKDQRAAPKNLLEQYTRNYQIDDEDEGVKATEKKTIAQDLRLADLAALSFPDGSSNFGIADLAGGDAADNLSELKIDLTADKATRDAIIAKQRAIIAVALPLALKAANLPTVIPGLTDVAPAAEGEDASFF